MDVSEQLSGIVRAFHLENPEASWSKLREHFRGVSAELFESGRDGDVTKVWGGLHYSNSGPVGVSTSPLKPSVSLSELAPAFDDSVSGVSRYRAYPLSAGDLYPHSPDLAAGKYGLDWELRF